MFSLILKFCQNTYIKSTEHRLRTTGIVCVWMERERQRLNCYTNGGAAAPNTLEFQCILKQCRWTEITVDYGILRNAHFGGGKMNSKKKKNENKTSHKIPSGNYEKMCVLSMRRR